MKFYYNFNFPINFTGRQHMQSMQHNQGLELNAVCQALYVSTWTLAVTLNFDTKHCRIHPCPKMH